MKTKLYSMWIKFCKAPEKWRAMYNNIWVDAMLGIQYSSYDVSIGKAINAIQEGLIVFNNKHGGIKATDGSPEYHAWNAFMTAKEPNEVIEFIVKNFKTFKSYLPATCMFLDLHSLKPRDMLKSCNKPLMEELKHALIADIDGRKCGK